jgi:hypothetical protein
MPDEIKKKEKWCIGINFSNINPIKSFYSLNLLSAYMFLYLIKP